MADLDPAELGTRFEILETLGEGAFGLVLKAHDRIEDRPVALKLLAPGELPGEFDALRHLQHPGVIPVLDVGRTATSDRGWFTMELVEGLLLHEAARAPDLWAARVARLLEALAFLHERGWIHADLKPDNVLVPSGEPDRAVLLDFGLALRQGDSGGVRGTPGFIAPEVLAGAEPSVASDLYALGALAAMAATGEFPFPPDEPNPGIDGTPEDWWLGPAVDPAARPWLGRLLQRDAAQRPSSAREALAALEAALGRPLADPDDAATRIAPTEPLGRDAALEDLAAVALDGGVAVVLGPRGSGRTTLLRAHAHALARDGVGVSVLSLGDRTSRAQRSLRTFLADRRATSAVPPDPASFDNPAELGAALRVYEASLSVDLREALAAAAGPVLVDDLEPDTVAGRAALRALELADAEHGVVVSGALDGRDAFEALLEHRSDPRDHLVLLEDLTPADLEAWLGAALGTVARADQLAYHLHDASSGVVGRAVELTGKLLRSGALRAGERQWQWAADAVEVELEEVRATLPTGFATMDVATVIADALAEAEELAAQGEVAAARRRLARQTARAERLRAPEADLVAPWIRLADLSAMMGEGDEAASWLERVRNAEGSDDARRAWCVAREAEALQNASRWTEALDLLDQHRDLLAAHGSDEDLARAASTRGSALLKMARFDDSRRVVEEALESLEDRLDVRQRIGMMLTAANADWHQGRHAHAEGVCRAAADILPDDLDGPVRAAVETTLATSLRLQGRHDDAAVLYVQARRRYRRLGRLLDAARVANNLGIVLYSKGDWLAAIEAWEDFRELVRRADNAYELVLAWNNLGCLYRDTGQLDRAEDAFDQALELARRYRYGRTIPMVLGNMAESSAVRGRTSLAEGQYAECIKEAAEVGADDEIVEAWRRVAQMYIDVGDLGRAGEAIEKARAVPEAGHAAQELRLADGLEAVIALQEGDADASARTEEVIDDLEEAGAALEAARMRLRYAFGLVRVDRYADAEEQVGLAVKVCDPLPARPELARAGDLRRLIAEATRNRLDAVTAHYDALQQLTLAISRERDLPTLLETILERTLDLVGEDRGYVLLMDETGTPDLTVAREVDETVIERQLHAVGPSKTVTQRVLETRKPLAVLDVEASESLRDQLSVVSQGVRSLICVPILRRRQLLGLIYVDSKSAVGGSADRKASLLMAAADAASVAIENTRLIDALRAKNDSIAIMAHELRTPLSAIVGFASVMLEGAGQDPVEDEEMLGIIKREAERTSEMVNRVLQLARMEARDVEPPKEIVDPLHIVVSAADTLRPLAAQAEVTIVADAGEDVPDLLGDADRLVQVAVNLLSNAVKFSPRGGNVWIRADRDADKGLLLVVEDEGPGIPEDRLGAIFEPYRQAGPKGMRSKGVGLGLAISRQIVRQHRGWIRAANRPDQGARFVVWLPTSLQSSTDVPTGGG